MGISLLETAMAETGLQEVETYGSHRQNTVTQFIATRPIMDLCLAEKLRTGSSSTNRWWDQDGLYVEGLGTEVWEAERMEREEETEGTETETY